MNRVQRFYLFMNALICLLCFISVFALRPAYASLPISLDKRASVILAYQKIDEPLSRDTSLTAEQFNVQITELLTEGYLILPLSQITSAFRSGETLPDLSVAITFDGPYRSAYEKAYPLLIKHRIPFTIFVSPQLMDSPRANTISWDELRDLARKYDFISFGLHPYMYQRLSGSDEDKISDSLNAAKRRFDHKMKDVLPISPAFFSYPFGEYTTAYRDIVETHNFDAALTLASGVAHAKMDIMQLPRFAMTDHYGALERFRMIVNATPLPITNWQPEPFYKASSLNSSNRDVTEISFQVIKEINALDLLRCFVSGQDTPVMSFGTEDQANHVTLSLAEPMASGRTRINCTMPGPATADILDTPRYRWHGMLYSLE